MPRIVGLEFGELTAWEVRSKGWYVVKVELGGGTEVSITFYDPVRLRQELESHFLQGKPYFAEPNLIVLPELTEDAMRNCMTKLIAAGYFAGYEVKQ